MIAVALTVLCATGAILILMGVAERPDYLENGKLQGKIILVGLLAANAGFLHSEVFPFLARSQPVAQWPRARWIRIALSVSFSNSLWFYCAFLGVAKIWNYTVDAGFVLALGLLIWALGSTLVHGALVLASRNEPIGRRDWIDSVKASLSGLAPLEPRHFADSTLRADD